MSVNGKDCMVLALEISDVRKTQLEETLKEMTENVSSGVVSTAIVNWQDIKANTLFTYLIIFFCNLFYTTKLINA